MTRRWRVATLAAALIGLGGMSAAWAETAADAPPPPASAASAASAVADQADEGAAPRTQAERVYAFQHRFLPYLAQQGGHELIDRLKASDGTARLQAAARDLVSSEYATKLRVSPLPAPLVGVLVEFPPPTVAPECFFVAFVRGGAGVPVAVYTYELMLPLWERQRLIGMLGGWNADGHFSIGPRSYRQSAGFVADLKRLMRPAKAGPSPRAPAP